MKHFKVLWVGSVCFCLSIQSLAMAKAKINPPEAVSQALKLINKKKVLGSILELIEFDVSAEEFNKINDVLKRHKVPMNRPITHFRSSGAHLYHRDGKKFSMKPDGMVIVDSKIYDLHKPLSVVLEQALSNNKKRKTTLRDLWIPEAKAKGKGWAVGAGLLALGGYVKHKFNDSKGDYKITCNGNQYRLRTRISFTSYQTEDIPMGHLKARLKRPGLLNGNPKCTGQLAKSLSADLNSPYKGSPKDGQYVPRGDNDRNGVDN